MTAGIQILNDNGIVQIDENYRNIHLVYKEVFATGGDHTITLSGRGSPVCVLYSTDTQGIAIMETSVSGSQFTWRVNGIGEVYIFDVPPIPSDHGSGLQVFDAAGSCAFDSNLEVFKPMGLRPFRAHFDRVDYPLQTISTQTSFYGDNTYNTILPGWNDGTGAGTQLYPYEKPTTRKWGWFHMGDPRAYYYTQSATYKSLVCAFASGNQFKIRMRDIGYVQGGEYWPGSSGTPINSLLFVDLEGL